MSEGNGDILKAIAELRSELRSGLTDLRTELQTELRSGLAELRTELVSTRTAVMDRIDRLQDVTQGMRDDIFVNFARADRAVDMAVGAVNGVAALSREVSGMQRQILGLRSELDELKRKDT